MLKVKEAVKAFEEIDEDIIIKVISLSEKKKSPYLYFDILKEGQKNYECYYNELVENVEYTNFCELCEAKIIVITFADHYLNYLENKNWQDHIKFAISDAILSIKLDSGKASFISGDINEIDKYIESTECDCGTLGNLEDRLAIGKYYHKANT
jgi:hypothetical protein